MNQIKVKKIIESVLRKKNIHGIAFGIESTDQRISYFHASGDLSVDSQYYIASINKLIVSAIILRYIRDGHLNFDDQLVEYLPSDSQKGLLIYQNDDYTNQITIRHLLSQTSGLPCFLIDKPSFGISGMKELEGGIDRPWPIEEVIERIRHLKPQSIPGEKARYIDTNHQLLTLVIEQIEQRSVALVIQDVFNELNMLDTYVYQDVQRADFIYPYYKGKQVDIRKFMASTNNDIISTAKDQMKFIKAFYAGHFYPQEKLVELENWQPIFFPFRYGIGVQQFFTPRIFSPFKRIPDLIGHCGSTGSVMFYIRELDLFVTGTTNQQANPQAMFQTIMRIVATLK